MFDPYKDMPFEEQLRRFLDRSQRYRIWSMNTIINWVKRTYIKKEPIKLPYYNAKRVRDTTILAKKLVEHGHATIDDEGYLHLNETILRMDYYIL